MLVRFGPLFFSFATALERGLVCPADLSSVANFLIGRVVWCCKVTPLGVSMASAGTTSVKLDPGLKERVQQLAAARRRSAHWILREAVEEYVTREEKREHFRQETLASWEHYQTTGLHVTDAEMDAWATKLEAGEDEPAPKCHV